MAYNIEYDSRALDDLAKVDTSAKRIILKAINRVAENPLPRTEGGYGWPLGNKQGRDLTWPLGNKQGRDLTNLLKIKMRGIGYRVVYELKRTESSMVIIVVGVRADEEVYRVAYERILKR